MEKTALVTGSSRGIGAAAARRLAADGWDVTIHYNQSEQAAMALAKQLHTRAVQADMTDPGQVEALFQTVGPVDLLVCNAGVAQYGLLTDITEDDWRHVLGVNIDGVYRCCRAAIPRASPRLCDAFRRSPKHCAARTGPSPRATRCA